MLGVLSLVIIFPLPIVLALMLNELRSQRFKRVIQTISYLPHFMSIVIVAGLVFQLTAMRGTVNQVITAIGGDAIGFMQLPEWFRTIYISSEIWQTVGWGTILYLAALSTIDPQLYEAARIDGANRWRQTWHVTLPGIRPTMVVLLILNIGTFMAVGFEKILLLYNPLLYPTADVIATYLYRVGIGSSQFSYATAIGLFERSSASPSSCRPTRSRAEWWEPPCGDRRQRHAPRQEAVEADRPGGQGDAGLHRVPRRQRDAPRPHRGDHALPVREPGRAGVQLRVVHQLGGRSRSGRAASTSRRSTSS